MKGRNDITVKPMEMYMYKPPMWLVLSASGTMVLQLHRSKYRKFNSLMAYLAVTIERKDLDTVWHISNFLLEYLSPFGRQGSTIWVRFVVAL